jgi:hypothetical protein
LTESKERKVLLRPIQRVRISVPDDAPIFSCPGKACSWPGSEKDKGSATARLRLKPGEGEQHLHGAHQPCDLLRKALVKPILHVKSPGLGVGVGTSQEEARNGVQSENLSAYISQMIGALQQYRTPRHTPNIDECGVTTRPLKDQRKRIVCLTDCQTAPRFRDVKGVSHVSVIGIVSLPCRSRLPFPLMVSHVPLCDSDLSWLRLDFAMCQSPKGYLTIPAMKCYIQVVIAPCVESPCANPSDLKAIMCVVMDSIGISTNLNMLKEFKQVGVERVWLPGHRSHFL